MHSFEKMPSPDRFGLSQILPKEREVEGWSKAAYFALQNDLPTCIGVRNTHRVSNPQKHKPSSMTSCQLWLTTCEAFVCPPLCDRFTTCVTQLPNFQKFKVWYPKQIGENPDRLLFIFSRVVLYGVLTKSSTSKNLLNRFFDKEL